MVHACRKTRNNEVLQQFQIAQCNSIGAIEPPLEAALVAVSSAVFCVTFDVIYLKLHLSVKDVLGVGHFWGTRWAMICLHAQVCVGHLGLFNDMLCPHRPYGQV